LIDFFKPARYPIAAAYGYIRVNFPVWNFLNRTSTSLFKKHPPNLDSLQKNIVDNILKNGIASANLDELFPKKNILSDLIHYVKNDTRIAKPHPRKPYLKHYWAEPTSETPEFDFDNPFIKLMINSRVLDMVNSYMNSCSKLIYFDLAKTSQMNQEDIPIASQCWHRDPGFKKQLKVFIYLNDVEKESGPFNYILGSHLNGKLRNIFPQKQFGRHGYYPPQDLDEEIFFKDSITSLTGRAGTIIFCDTIGLHKGGFTTLGSRIMFSSMFVPSGDVIKPMFTLPENFQKKAENLDEVSFFSVT